MQDKLAFSLTRYDGSVAARAAAAALCNRGGYRIVVWPATNCIRASAKRDKVAAAPRRLLPPRLCAKKRRQLISGSENLTAHLTVYIHTYPISLKLYDEMFYGDV